MIYKLQTLIFCGAHFLFINIFFLLRKFYKQNYDWYFAACQRCALQNCSTGAYMGGAYKTILRVLQ
jgi:hypothetical protein